MSNVKNLAERLLAFEKALNDGTDVYAGEALKHGKGLEKAKKGRSNLARDNDEEPLVVIDSTVWGAVTEGFYITENYIYGKELFEKLNSFSVEGIYTIQVDESNKSIFINGTSIKWLADTITPKMKIIAECIQEQIDSRINISSAIQEGMSAYLEKLNDQIYILQTATWRWGVDITLKLINTTGKMFEYTPFGDENFLRRTAISIARSDALKTYDSTRKEIELKIRSLNESVPVKHSNDLFRQYELNEIEFSFDFGQGPDRNIEISNDDWQSNTEDAFNQLQECGSDLERQFQDIMDKLTIIQNNECEEDD